MTKINRSSIESTIIAGILVILRKCLTDPLNPKRTNSNWIRNSAKVTETPTTNYGRKHYIVKESAKPLYPQVIVQSYDEDNKQKYITSKYETTSNCIIRIMDIGDPTRVGGLGGQISNIVKTHLSDFYKLGIKNLSFTATPTVEGGDGENDFYEKEITLSYTVIVNE